MNLFTTSGLLSRGSHFFSAILLAAEEDRRSPGSRGGEPRDSDVESRRTKLQSKNPECSRAWERGAEEAGILDCQAKSETWANTAVLRLIIQCQVYRGASFRTLETLTSPENPREGMSS
mmetsp:Transcript_22713/g.35553  ORF Transcript_22713/g.35553 Transcript_22713/m.35553 type:complete len:119 (-) Transcript_22713:35-391(-)